jgi:acetyl esterase/lipase
MPYAFEPDLAPIVELMASAPAADVHDIAASRASLLVRTAAMNAAVDLAGLTVEDRTVAGGVPVRIYAPQQRRGLLPAVLYLHGGGFVVGDLDTEHSQTALIARDVQAVVISVDYRLAPEHPYPAGLDDCYAVLEWLAAEALALGVDAARIAVYGSSAGGGLAAGVTLLARDRRGPAIRFQMLRLPDLDDRCDTPSMRAFVDTPGWNRPLAEYSWQLYLGVDGEADAYAAPARAETLVGLPPAYISTAEFDPLRDEGIRYAMRLLEAGVNVELHQFAGTFHGSGIVPTADSSIRQTEESIHVLRRALAGTADKNPTEQM